MVNHVSQNSDRRSGWSVPSINDQTLGANEIGQQSSTAPLGPAIEPVAESVVQSAKSPAIPPVPATTAAEPGPTILLDPDVSFTPVSIAGVSMARCVHAGTGMHFQFGAAEHHVALLLDGTRSVSEIVQQLETDGLDWTPRDVADFIGVLVIQKLAIAQTPPAPRTVPPNEVEKVSDTFDVDNEVSKVSEVDKVSDTSMATPDKVSDTLSAGPNDSRRSDASAGCERHRGLCLLLSLLNGKTLAAVTKACGYAISLRFPLVHGNPWAARVTPIVRPLLSGMGMVIAGSVVVVSMLFASLHHARLTDELMRVFDSNQWLVMLVVWAVLKIIHELGHACMAHDHGVRVGRAGITFFMFAPLAYVDVTDAWKLPRRRSRVAIALGGVYFELICASIAVWVWWLMPGGVIAHVAAQIFFIAGPATLLVNANPLLRLDGYYVASDLADVPNLREQGRKLFGGAIERTLLHMQSPASHLAGWRRSFAAIHAAASIVFQFVWMSGLVIVISMWAGPLGLLIAACALLLWGVLPTGRWLHRVWMYDSGEETFSRGSHRRRIMWTGVSVALVGQFLITLPSPLAIEVPAITRFSGDQILRAPASGFVRQVYLDSGQKVRAGEVILEIENDELTAKRDEIAWELEAETIQWQLSEQQSALGLAEASVQRGESLKRKLAELDEQVAAMRVKTLDDGEILTPRLAELKDQYVTHGHEIVQVGNRAHKELLISIGEGEMDAYRRAIEQGETLRVCFRSGQWVDIVPLPMRPRGSRLVSHPALAATAGGPLPVAPKHDAQQDGPAVQWITPRFEAIVPLPPGQSDSVHCGEVGMLALQDQRSLVRRFWQWLKRDETR